MASSSRGLPYDRARPDALTLVPPVEHRSDGQGNCGDIDRSGNHQVGGHDLVTSNRKDHPVQWIAEQQFDQSEVGQLAVQSRRGSLPCLLDRMNRKLERNAADFPNPVFDTRRKCQMVLVAGSQVAAGLRDSDDRATRCSSATERPKFLYRSTYNALISACVGSSNQLRERSCTRRSEWSLLLTSLCGNDFDMLLSELTGRHGSRLKPAA